ncbi:MAG: multidrug efflux pump subunit AcrA (membrane-fusion protein) [Hyphomicrobiaceae bacterium]|jgi:multidrug efflux pump subunit AcrA (membrane-fusion protein)
MKRSKLFPIPVLLLCLTLPACKRGSDDSGEAAEEVGEQPTNRVDIPTSVRRNLGITFAKVERRDVANTIRVPGSFELQPLARREYRLMLPGHIEFAVDQFDKVEVGTLLYRFRSAKWLELQSRVDLANASLEQSRAKSAAVEARIKVLEKAAFKRADLAAQAAELRADIPKQEAELRAATAALNNAGQARDRVGGTGTAVPQMIDWIEVRAKEPGIVESLSVTDGTFVEETTLLLTTVDPSLVRFRALGLQSDLLKFKGGQNVRIVQPQANGSNLNESIEADLKIGLAADPIQRTVTLFATPKELRPWSLAGVSAFLEIATESTDGVALAIPRSAVVKDGIVHVFFKRDPGNANKAIRIEADLGVDDGRWVEIKSDLGPNDEVVLNGAYELKLATAMSGTSQKGGHFHADGAFHEKH